MKKLSLSLGLLFLLASPVWAKKLKIAVLVPEGTAMADSMKDFAKIVKSKTSGRVAFKVYYGGVAGDESDVLRKVRVGQMHGGIFTGKTLGDIYSDARILEVPFNFYADEEKAFNSMKKLESFITKGIEQKGFVNLGLYEIGNVYLVSTKKAASINELKGVKIWAWEGDRIVKAMMKELGLVSVPLALPDVLSSLSTGIINAAYAPPLGIIALQWQSKVKYLIDFPVAYSTGAFLISKKAWEKIKAPDQKILREVAKEVSDAANKRARQENAQGLIELKKMGVEFVSFDEKDKAQAEKIRKNVLTSLTGNVFSPAAVKTLKSVR